MGMVEEIVTVGNSSAATPWRRTMLSRDAKTKS